MNSKHIHNRPSEPPRELHRLLIEQASDIIFVADEQGRFLEIGGRGTKWLGYSHEVLSRLSLQDLIFSGDGDTSLLNEEELPVDVVVTKACRLSCWDGRLLWAKMSVIRLSDRRLTGILCPTIPDGQRAYGKYDENDCGLSLIKNAAWLYVRTRIEEVPVVVDCNARFLDGLGYSRSEVIGKPLASFYSLESAALMSKYGYVDALHGQFIDQERTLVTRDGRTLQTLLHAGPDVDLDGRVVGTHAIYLDITERKQMEEALSKSTSWFSLIFQHSPIGKAITDLSSHVLIDINEAGLKLWEYTREEVVGRRTLDIGLWGNPLDRQHLLEQLAIQGRVTEFETIFISKSGNKCHVLLYAEQIQLDNQPTLLMQFIDITDQKRGELLEVEQRHIAYVLHDGLAQLNTSIHQHLQAFSHDYSPRRLQAKQQLAMIMDLAQNAVREVRHVMEGLRPTTLDDFGLATALRLQIQKLEVEGWDIDSRIPESLERWPPMVETVLFRIAQESLTNIRKHAQTTRVQVVLDLKPECYALEIKDWGNGFDVASTTAAKPHSGHRGIMGMRQRIVLLDGEFSIQSTPGIGTQIIAKIPRKLGFK